MTAKPEPLTDEDSPRCLHPASRKEYLLGMSTGDRECLVCGEVFTPARKAR